MSTAIDDLEETQITVLDLPLEFKVSQYFYFIWNLFSNSSINSMRIILIITNNLFNYLSRLFVIIGFIGMFPFISPVQLKN